MRRVCAWELVSVDGVMESPEEWAFPYSDAEMGETSASGMAASDALLLGRVTYEHLAAYWPNQPAGTPMVDYINSVAKYVVSTTLEEPLEWNNSTLINCKEFAEEVAELKQQEGKDITIISSGELVRSLLSERLLDELRLMVHPLILGGGKRLFEDGGDRQALELVDSRRFGSGVLSLTYRPAMFATIGVGQWFRYAVGALELAGAVGVLIPRLCGLAALGLVGLMAGATLTNVLVLGTSPLLPIVLLVVSAVVAWGRWPRTRTFFTNREAGRL